MLSGLGYTFIRYTPVYMYISLGLDLLIPILEHRPFFPWCPLRLAQVARNCCVCKAATDQKEHDVHSQIQNPGSHLSWPAIKGPVPFLSTALPHLKAAVYPSIYSQHLIVCQRINKTTLAVRRKNAFFFLRAANRSSAETFPL